MLRSVVIQFHASWCAPCRALTPRLQKVAAEFKGEVELERIDVDEQPERAKALNVRGVPTLVALQGDREISRHVGTLSDDSLRAFFESAKSGIPAKLGLAAPRRLLAAVLGFGLVVLAQGDRTWLLAAGIPLLVWGMADACPLCALGTSGVSKVWRRLTGGQRVP